jgi:hypothetical protein
MPHRPAQQARDDHREDQIEGKRAQAEPKRSVTTGKRDYRVGRRDRREAIERGCEDVQAQEGECQQRHIAVQ